MKGIILAGGSGKRKSYSYKGYDYKSYDTGSYDPKNRGDRAGKAE